MNKPFTLPVACEQDRYGWAQRQAALLRSGWIAEVDAVHVAEEIDDVAGAEYDRLESALRVLLVHMLKWDHQPDRRSRSWTLTIREQRNRINRSLRKNPSLKTAVDEAVADVYEDAILGAARETGLPETVFPNTNPYSWQEINERAHP